MELRKRGCRFAENQPADSAGPENGLTDRYYAIRLISSA